MCHLEAVMGEKKEEKKDAQGSNSSRLRRGIFVQETGGENMS